MKQTAKEKTISNELERLLPNVTINCSRAGNDEGVNYSHFFIPPENKFLKDSEYFYDGKHSFIHFTNLFALQSIISQRNIRLYNLHNLNDPREYSFAGNLTKFNKTNKKDAKDRFFLLSMCKTEILTKSTGIEFNMWRLYGGNGTGIAIELNFDNNPSINWSDYFLAQVQYGAESKSRLNEIKKLLTKLESLKPLVSVDLGQIFCYHKTKLYNLEDETRLLFDYRAVKVVGASTYKSKEGEITSPIIKTDILKSVGTKDVNYLELPIHHKDFKPVFNNNNIPIPKIERIIIGYHYKDNFNKVSTLLKKLCEERLGYTPKIEKSRLTKYYHDTI